MRGSWRPDHSSSEVPGVVGISVLEQADILVREGVGERVLSGDEGRRSRRRGGLDARDVSLTGEDGSDKEASRNISNVLRRTDRCICFTDDDEARGAVRDPVLGHPSAAVEPPRNRANSSLP